MNHSTTRKYKNMTTYLTCKKCGFNFAMNTSEYLANGPECPRCGIAEMKRNEHCAECGMPLTRDEDIERGACPSCYELAVCPEALRGDES